MLSNHKKSAVIVGAGFSRSLGVPAYAEIMKTIATNLDESEYSLTQLQKEIDREITTHIRKFLLNVFDCDILQNDEIPSLEQVFTFIDLSLKSEHYLGQSYRPEMLKALRRFLTYKLFLIIDKSIDYSSHEFISRLFNALEDCDYISLNWDIVLEQCLKMYVHRDFSYGIDEVIVEMSSGRLKLYDNADHNFDSSKIAKVHGSANWAYCGNCHKVFCMKDVKITKIIQSGIYVSDIKLFYDIHETDKDGKQDFKQKLRTEVSKKKCPICSRSLESHIANFSYNKTFSTHAFNDSWELAENILSEAGRWIFIGYSLPDADFIFTHMLKCVQKRTDAPKEIIAIVKEDNSAKAKYLSMFGKRNVHFFNNGLNDFIVNNLDTLI